MFHSHAFLRLIEAIEPAAEISFGLPNPSTPAPIHPNRAQEGHHCATTESMSTAPLPCSRARQ